MAAKLKVFALIGSLSFVLADAAFAFHWRGPRVPEFDATSGVVAVALLISVGAVLFNRSRNK
jgi:hypothetical protein